MGNNNKYNILILSAIIMVLSFLFLMADYTTVSAFSMSNIKTVKKSFFPLKTSSSTSSVKLGNFGKWKAADKTKKYESEESFAVATAYKNNSTLFSPSSHIAIKLWNSDLDEVKLYNNNMLRKTAFTAEEILYCIKRGNNYYLLNIHEDTIIKIRGGISYGARFNCDLECYEELKSECLDLDV